MCLWGNPRAEPRPLWVYIYPDMFCHLLLKVSLGNPKIILVLTTMLLAMQLFIASSILWGFIFFLISLSVLLEPLSGEKLRFLQPEAYNSSDISPSIASERVPLGNCHVIFTFLSITSLVNASIHLLSTIAVRS